MAINNIQAMNGDINMNVLEDVEINKEACKDVLIKANAIIKEINC